MITLSLEINGEIETRLVEARETLADFLRERCNLTGTHLGCEHGACGACTVTIDGVTARSCVTLAVMCESRSVLTIEGLRDDPAMLVLRRHFREAHALQCGYCTPGMLIAARDILSRHRAPQEPTVRRELGGHLCRCTGYAGIVAAILAAGAELAAAPAQPQSVKEEA